jgi:hypothetical protein
MNLTFQVNELKSLRTVAGKSDFLQWDKQHPAFSPIEISQLKLSSGKFRIPANAID